LSPKPAARPVIQSISIKEAMACKPQPTEPKPEPEPEPARIEVVNASPPSEDLGGFDLGGFWNAFADTVKTSDPRLFSMLTAHAPNLEGGTKIVFPIGNPLQKEPLQKILPDLLQHIRTALNNENIEIEILLTEKTETTKAYTAEDKFAQMSRKNPALMTLKQQFALDFE
jgi:DNA polymerase-3 subunit gamma/tau